MGHSILGIDAALAGLSGDMLVGSLLGLVDSAEEELKNFESYYKTINSQFKSRVEPSMYKDAKGYTLRMEGGGYHIETDDLSQELQKAMKHFNVKPFYAEIGYMALKYLIEGERQIHGDDKVQLHELGTLDTIFDMVSVCYLLQALRIESIQFGQIATGSGSVQTSHGILPVPAPITLHLLQRFSISSTVGPQGGEALTPTGLALLCAMKEHLFLVKNVTWKVHSHGFGVKKWDDRGNYVRVRLGSSTETPSTISMLETHLDDVSGEHLGHTIEMLMELGCNDVSYYPLFMKKNRPGYCLRVLVTSDLVHEASIMIQRLTGSLGIRVTEVNRHLGSRSTKLVKTRYNGTDIEFRLKIGDFGWKIEFEDLRNLSRTLGLTPKELEKELLKNINEV